MYPNPNKDTQVGVMTPDGGYSPTFPSPNPSNSDLPASALEFYKWLSQQNTSTQGQGFNFDIYGKFNPMFEGLDGAGAASLSNDLQLQKAQFDAQIALMNWQTWYNSEAQKIKRMRAVGLNPDLVGLESASDASGSIGSQLGGETSAAIQSDVAIRNAAVAERQANLQAALAVPQMLLQGISAVSSLAGTIGSLGVMVKQKNLLNKQSELLSAQTDGVKLDNYSKIRGTAKDLILDNLSALIGVGDDLSSVSDSVIESAFNNAHSSITGDSVLDRMLRKELGAVRNNPEVLKRYWTDYSDTIKSRTEAAKGLANPYYSDNLAYMVEPYKPVLQASLDVTIKEFDKQLSELDYQIDYYQGLSGDKSASAQNALNDAQAAVSGFKTDVYSNLNGYDFASATNESYSELYRSLLYRRNLLYAIREVAQEFWDNAHSDNIGNNIQAFLGAGLLGGFESIINAVPGSGTIFKQAGNAPTISPLP